MSCANLAFLSLSCDEIQAFQNLFAAYPMQSYGNVANTFCKACLSVHGGGRRTRFAQIIKYSLKYKKLVYIVDKGRFVLSERQ
jgi:hypothetical protein